MKRTMNLFKSSPMKEKPTEEEIKNQFLIKGISDKKEPQKFYAYYESVGWRVGNKKMVSWRGAVANWVLRMDQFNPQNKNSQSNEERIKATYNKMRDIKL